MSPITTHVLDTARGCPASGVPISLFKQGPLDDWVELGSGITDADGRIRDLLPESQPLEKGLYKMVFETGRYFQHLQLRGFYPQVSVTFDVQEPQQHYHIPLLLSPYGYSTYRGS